MPEFHNSIGGAVGAAMSHNIRLAHRKASACDPAGAATSTTTGAVKATPAPHNEGLSDLDASVNRAERFGTDVEIFHWEGEAVWADTHTGIAPYAHRLLESFGFVPVHHPGVLTSHELHTHLPWPVQQVHATTAAGFLTASGFIVNLDPDLYTDDLVYDIARYRVSRADAATLTSPATAGHKPSPAQQFVPPVPLATATTIRRTR